jgi:L-ribulose-5-phosphate 3-epimerase
MRSAINIWAFPRDWPVEKVLWLARDAGFEALEPDYGPGRPLHAGSTEADARALRRRCQDAGLAISSLASSVFWQVNLLSDDAGERAAAKAHVRHMVRLGAALEVDALLIVPGFVGPFEAGPPVVADYEVTYRRAVDDFRELAVEATRAGVVLGIETVWNKFLTSPVEMRAFVDAVDSPFVGVYLDVGNVLRTGYPEQWIQVLGPRVRKVHFKDFKVGIGNLGGFVDLLRGDVNFPAVMAALRQVGYDGDAAVEMFPKPELAEHCIRQAAQDMRHILAMA